MSTTKKSNVSQDKKTPNVSPESMEPTVITKEIVVYPWSNGKHEKCKTCGTQELKHYSGGECTSCYTDRRNKKLGLGKYDPAKNQRRLERAIAKQDRLIAELADVEATIAELQK